MTTGSFRVGHSDSTARQRPEERTMTTGSFRVGPRIPRRDSAQMTTGSGAAHSDSAARWRRREP